MHKKRFVVVRVQLAPETGSDIWGSIYASTKEEALDRLMAHLRAEPRGIEGSHTLSPESRRSYQGTALYVHEKFLDDFDASKESPISQPLELAYLYEIHDLDADYLVTLGRQEANMEKEEEKVYERVFEPQMWDYAPALHNLYLAGWQPEIQYLRVTSNDRRLMEINFPFIRPGEKIVEFGGEGEEISTISVEILTRNPRGNDG